MDLPDSVQGVERAFVERLVNRCRDDDRVAALFVGGSHAAGTADEHSDLDLYLVATDDGFADLRAERYALLTELGDPVFLEEHEDFGFLMVLYMYADGVHGEMALAPESQIGEIHSGPYRTLFDHTGVLRDREFPPWRLDDTERATLIRHRLVWFWYDRRLLDVALARDRLWTALHHLDRCRRQVVDLARLRARPDEWPSGLEKVETVESGILARLAGTVVPLRPQDLADASALVTAVYRELARDLAETHGVDYPTRIDELISGGG